MQTFSLRISESNADQFALQVLKEQEDYNRE